MTDTPVGRDATPAAGEDARTTLRFLRFEAIAVRFEPITVRFEPIVVRFEPIVVRFEPIVVRFERLAVRFEAIVIRFRTSTDGLNQTCPESARIALRSAHHPIP